jgi:hypothetical protein
VNGATAAAVIAAGAAAATFDTVAVIAAVMLDHAAADWVQGGAVAAGMVAAWRVMAKAHSDAVDTYRTSAQDETSRLQIERERWDAERATLLAERDRLLTELRQRSGSDNPPPV